MTVCTLGRQEAFHSLSLSAEAVRLLESTGEVHAVDVYAYCLMPDHAHVLAAPTGKASLVEFVRDWKSLTDRAWRARQNTRSLWQRSFYDHVLRDEESVEIAARYIVSNPVRAGMVLDWRDYPFSGSLVWEL